MAAWSLHLRARRDIRAEQWRAAWRVALSWSDGNLIYLSFISTFLLITIYILFLYHLSNKCAIENNLNYLRIEKFFFNKVC